MSPLMIEVLASQDAISKQYDELAARRITRKTNAAIAAIERMQQEHELELQSPAAIELERLHAARVDERAALARSSFKLVSN